MLRSAMFLSSLILFLFVMTSFGFNKESLKNPETRKKAVENLLNGLQNDNYGLKTSSAFMLGEIRAEEAVYPLMKMLKTDDCEESRIVAALALYKIGNPKGLFAVKQATRFDNSERVKKMCKNFYNEVLKDRYGAVAFEKEDSEVAIR